MLVSYAVIKQLKPLSTKRRLSLEYLESGYNYLHRDGTGWPLHNLML